ncbi:hypothetical protein [Arthrobacter sp. StoSoilB22]|uniref:hypothetical protein n=1 Tax=Arthrobacter sp. StoSoilB22 TaxID=2830996 RepID=UPI001CC70BAD|nr:hypothetical protein [Arthrobacter sp. StoSoilB22]BCW61876.1 hypothetical protein StoSoilB22_08490 [Arthrobacter sp. StoSoilB22]
MSDHHHITVTAQYDKDGTELEPEVKFECRGNDDAPCHIYPDCGCEAWEEGHEQQHPYTHHQTCWMSDWFEAGAHNYDGEDRDDMSDCSIPAGMNRSGPIEPTFEDEYIAWQFKEAVPTGAASVIQGERP